MTSIIAFDLDSTLVSIEGAVELAKMKNKLARVQELTNKAMNGEIPFDQIILERHKILSPTHYELEKLGDLYIETVVPKIIDVLNTLKNEPQVKVYILTAGYDIPTYMVAKVLGVSSQNIYSQLWFKNAKLHILEKLKNTLQPKRIIMVGDGANDLVTQPVTDYFVGAGYIVKRPVVQQKADYFVDSVEELKKVLAKLIA